MARNQTSWTKGQSGNSNGRPKREWTWAGELEEAMQEAAEDGKPVKYHIARSLANQATKGNLQAIKILMDRMDGQPQQNTFIPSQETTFVITRGESIKKA